MAHACAKCRIRSGTGDGPIDAIDAIDAIPDPIDAIGANGRIGANRGANRGANPGGGKK